MNSDSQVLFRSQFGISPGKQRREPAFFNELGLPTSPVIVNGGIQVRGQSKTPWLKRIAEQRHMSRNETLNATLQCLAMGTQTQDSQAFNRKRLLELVLRQFRISRDGVHGPNHWARVRKHALTVGAATGSDLLVVELFAFLHDSQRRNEDEDPLHGERAAVFAASLNGREFDLNTGQQEKLYFAIRHHSDGGRHQDSTIQTCWDADRLDLGRVGIKPVARYLSAAGAREIEAAYQWSLQCPDEFDVSLWDLV